MKKVILILSSICTILNSCKQNLIEPESKHPTVKIVSLENGAIVLDSVLIEIDASDEKEITKIEIYIDGITDSSRMLFEKPYKYIWLTPQFEDSSKHQIYAVAYNASGNFTQTKALTINVYKFQAPSLLQIVYMSDELVKLKWEDNSVDETGYQVDMSLGSNNFVFVQNLPPNTDSTSIPGTYIKDSTYYFRVTVKRNDKSATSLEIGNKLVFQAPTISNVEFLCDTAVQLHWFDNSTFERDFEIEQSEDGINYIVIDSMSANITSTIAKSVFFSGVTYSFRMRAKSMNNATDFSPVVSKQFSFIAPQRLVIDSMSETSLILFWTNENKAVSTIFVEKSTNAQDFAIIDSIDFPLAKVKIKRIFSTDTTYSFRLRTKSKYNISAYSNVVAQKLTFPAPSDLRVVSISQDEINLLWSDNSSFRSQFVVERSDNEGNTYERIASTSLLSVKETGLHEEKDYLYRVRAFTEYNVSKNSIPLKIHSTPDSAFLTFQKGGFSGEAFGPEALSPNRKYIAIGVGHFYTNPATYSVFIIDSDLKQIIYDFKGFTKEVTCLQFSSDGKFLATGDQSGEVQIWNISNGMMVNSFLCSSAVTALTYSVNDQTIACGSNGVELHDVSSGNVVSNWSENGEIRDLIFMDDGSNIIVATSTGAINWRNSISGTLNKTQTITNTNKFKFSANGEFLVGIAGEEMVVKKIADWTTVQSINAKSTSAIISNDGKFIVYVNSGYSGSTYGFVFDIVSNFLVKELQMGGPHDAVPLSIGSSSDGLTIVSGCGGIISVWQLSYMWRSVP